MCSCQGCNPLITKTPHCRKCLQDFGRPLDDSRVGEYHRLVSSFEWDCKYCKETARSVENKATPNLEDILNDISKLKLKLTNLLSDMNEVKTDLVDLKTTAATTCTYMKDVNGKVRNLEERIVKLDKSSSNFHALHQTIVKFEHDIGNKEYNMVETNNNKMKYNTKDLLYYDILPDIPDKLARDRNSFIAKLQSGLRSAPKRLWSTILTDANKKTSLFRCEV